MKLPLLLIFLFHSGFLISFQVQRCSAFYLSYVAFVSSLKLKQLGGYSIPSLYSFDYFNSEGPVDLIEKRVTTGGIIPFETNLDFCQGQNYSDSRILNLLEVLFFGERRSPYEISFDKNETCIYVCTKTYIGGKAEDEEKLGALKKAIQFHYKHHWIVDNIPITWCPFKENTTQHCSTGFPIGCCLECDFPDEFCASVEQWDSSKNFYLIFNHFDLVITYERFLNIYNEDVSKIVSVKVTPMSLNHSNHLDCSSEQFRVPMKIPVGNMPEGERLDIKYSYSVKFIRNDTMKWASRWEYILSSISFSDLHWDMLICTILVVLFFVLIPVIIIKTVYKDATLYKKMDCGEDVEEKLRWRLVTNTFIPSSISFSLSVLLGSAIQLVFMAISSLVFALLAFIKSENRAVEMTWMLMLFICQGTVGGYTTSILYKSFGGEQWKSNILASTIICPGISVSTFVLLNTVLLFKDSSASIPYYTLSGFLGVIFLCLVPFTLAGSLFSFKEEVKLLVIECQKWISKIREGFNFKVPTNTHLTSQSC